MSRFPVDVPDLPAALRLLLGQIPPGRVATYGALAEALGDPAAARWVGHWMLHHDHRPRCPCHRVVRADGRLGRFVGGDPSEKTALLQAEGVLVRGEKVDDPRGFFCEFRSGRPLEALARMQDALRRMIRARGRKTLPESVAGVDVSYQGDQGVAAYVLWSLKGRRRVWSTTIRRPIRFPYISGFLAFRELAILLELLQTAARAGRAAEVVLVDGSGILHPRGAGIACHLGVLAQATTIGVSKKLLCGAVDLGGIEPGQSLPVMMGGRCRGVALRPTAGSRRPIFVSPGHRIDVDLAERIVRATLEQRRLPEPLYWADRISRRRANAAGP